MDNNNFIFKIKYTRFIYLALVGTFSFDLIIIIIFLVTPNRRDSDLRRGQSLYSRERETIGEKYTAVSIREEENYGIITVIEKLYSITICACIITRITE